MKSTEKEMLTIEKQRLIALCEAFHTMNELEKEEQLSELFLKVTQEEYAVAFCGHFSAGKSSLINALSNTGILPASPIPTSANIVKMKQGEPKAVVWLKNKNVVTFDYPYDVEEIKRFCKDGKQVQSIEIYYESEKNDSNIAFYDTPGIDSTDSAHKEATENVIHLADLIFYVMDYNHILSETNVEFIKELMKKGKSVRLIINQIDKHRDEELSFKDFKEKVFDSFKIYGIDKEQIYFTSVKEQSFPHNDLSALAAYIAKIEMNKDRLLLQGTNRQLNHFVSDYIEQEETGKNQLEKILKKLDILRLEKDKLQSELKQNEDLIKEKVESIRNHFMKIVDSAQLMPYETREKAGLFIESTKKDFKVGLLFSKQKTNHERQERKVAFQVKLLESIDAHINWHAQNYINILQKEFTIELPQWETINLEEEVLFSFVQSGLSSKGQGLLNYCDSIAGEAKKRARQQMSTIIAYVREELEITQNESLHHSSTTEKQLDHDIEVLMAEKENAIKWEDQKNDLRNILSSDIKSLYSIEEYEQNYASQYEPISVTQFKEMYSEDLETITFDTEPEMTKSLSIDQQVEGSLENETEKLKKTASLLRPISQLRVLSEDMGGLAKRLENRSFTMVLFGAFSAGKSSFANALLGENILPSSPNPTTAAINEVRKPDHENQHGSVKIDMKSDKEIFAEINSIVKSDHEDLDSLMNHLIKIQSLDQYHDKHFKHLQAFKDGYSFAKKYLNQSLTTDLSEIEKYAAIESNACFVKKMTVYFSCPLTEKGIVLVDTPGANSIHSRHTEVAFEYMKHADIILYLTYFNHAFSYADREFLIQLGRIKDTFTSDKMFFAINASDLANSEEDKEAVVDHVKNNLQTFGIRHPRLFPVSSKEEIKDPESTDSGFSSFRNSLHHYLENDLEQAMILSAEASQVHAKSVIRNMISETKLRLEKEDEYLETIQKREDSLLKICEDNLSLSSKRLNQEMKELLFYVKQRVIIRYHDLYKETIHPAAVKSSKNELLLCLDELYEKIAHDLQQEYRASSLRLDKWIQTHLNEKEKTILSEANLFQVSLQHSPEDKTLYITPPNPSPFNEASNADKWLAYFKNPKQFFENGGSNELRSKLVKTVEVEIAAWIESVETVLINHYLTVVKNAEHHSKTNFIMQIHQYFSELKKPGDLKGRIEILQSCLSEIENTAF